LERSERKKEKEEIEPFVSSPFSTCFLLGGASEKGFPYPVFISCRIGYKLAIRVCFSLLPNS
jgi:hypothetical protein